MVIFKILCSAATGACNVIDEMSATETQHSKLKSRVTRLSKYLSM